MTERAQALEALKRVARDIGTVKDVASRRSDPDRDNRRMLARLSAWRSEILRALNILEAVPPRPPVGSPTTPDMGQGWFVTAGRWGDSIVTIEEKSLSGKPDFTPEDQALVRGAALHLLAFIGQPTPVEPAGMTGQVRLCGALHMDTGAVCELPLDHTENHRGSFSRGIAQWPYESVEPAGASDPPRQHYVETPPHHRVVGVFSDGSYMIEHGDGQREHVYVRRSAKGYQAARVQGEPAGASEPPSEKRLQLSTGAQMDLVYRSGQFVPHSMPTELIFSAPVSPVAPEPPTEKAGWGSGERGVVFGPYVVSYPTPEPPKNEQCPYCSFDPTSMNDYCSKHRPDKPTGTPAPCVWRQVGHDWVTACGFTHGETAVGFTWCPYCGHPLTVER